LRYDEFIGSWTINAKSIKQVDSVIESNAKSLILNIKSDDKCNNTLSELHDILLPFREGHCNVLVHYIGDEASAKLSLGTEWAVKPSRKLLDKLTELLGNNNVRLLFSHNRLLN
jgi:DNA polymerase-3 subunit alpha